jgi:hypothetical protein
VRVQKGGSELSLPEKQTPVRWPFTKTTSVPVSRGFAAWNLEATRRHNGRVAGYQARAHYLAANGRPFQWPVRGASTMGRKAAANG